MDAYQILGVLLPHADLEHLAQVEQTIFDRVWGMSMRQMVDVGYVLAGVNLLVFLWRNFQRG